MRKFFRHESREKSPTQYMRISLVLIEQIPIIDLSNLSHQRFSWEPIVCIVPSLFLLVYF